MSRLIHLRNSLSRFQSTTAAVRNRRFLSTDTSNKVDEPFKVEEAETVDSTPPPADKLLVLGGNGYVGSHVCKEALDRGISVGSLSRSGKPSIDEPWANNVIWHQGNLLSDDSWKEALSGVTAVISCVGGFGSNSYMYKINGTANINAIRAAAEQGKVHGSLTRAGKVRGQTPKVVKQDKKKKSRSRAHKREQYNRRFVTAAKYLKAQRSSSKKVKLAAVGASVGAVVLTSSYDFRSLDVRTKLAME